MVTVDKNLWPSCGHETPSSLFGSCQYHTCSEEMWRLPSHGSILLYLAFVRIHRKQPFPWGSSEMRALTVPSRLRWWQNPFPKVPSPLTKCHLDQVPGNRAVSRIVTCRHADGVWCFELGNRDLSCEAGKWVGPSQRLWCVVLTPGCEWVRFSAYPGGKDRALDT